MYKPILSILFAASSYSLAVALCFLTMFCWGSWANTMKLVSKSWPNSLYYWDHSRGILLLTVIYGLTPGSLGETGKSFIPDLKQASTSVSAFPGEVIFNLSNLFIFTAIAMAGMAIANPLAIGLTIVIGVVPIIPAR